MSDINGYLMLGVGDVLRSGDEFLNHFDGRWYPTECAGMSVGVKNRTAIEYRRPVSKQAGSCATLGTVSKCPK
jgi:hypothetical protein